MKTKWLLVIVLAACAGYGFWTYRQKQARPAEAYREIQVERGTIRRTVLATGIVEPQNRVELKPPIGGRVEDVLVREGEAVAKAQVLAWISSSERAALLDAARAKGEEELAHWESLYKPAPLLAPLAGTIIARKVEPGQTVTAADPVLVLADRLIVKAQVDETDIGRIRIGQPAEIVLDAYAGESMRARVDHIAYEAETVNNVTIYKVDVVPERVPDFMRSGMTANVTVLVEARENVLLLPSGAVHREGAAAVVRVPGREGATVPVETGLDDGKWVEIVSGVSEGDAVLVSAFTLPSAPDRLTSPFAPTMRRGRR